MRISNIITRFEPYIYMVLRIVTGFLFLWHGSQKIFDFPQPGHPATTFISWAGGTIEFFGGLLVMTGFLTRWTAFVCSGEMAYAYWVYHGTNTILPFQNHGELAMLYCFLFLFIFFHGSGIFSIDNLLSKKRNV
jgi:putative oxidoreductase